MDAHHNKRIYELTRQYIVEEMLNKHGIPDIIDPYLFPSVELRQFTTLNQLYARLLAHGSNRGNGGNAIRSVFGTYRIEGKDGDNKRWAQTEELLFGFDPVEVKANYTIYSLFNKLAHKPYRVSDPTIPVYGYCKTILDAANYFTGAFSKEPDPVEAFYSHFEQVSTDREIAEKVVQKELGVITGIGDALSLDYLKELGFTNFIKPDVHTMDICFYLGYTTDKKDADGTILSMKQIADDAGVTPYALDKMFWLIGSGGFYDLPQVNPEYSRKARDKWDSSRKATVRKETFRDYIQARSAR